MDSPVIVGRKVGIMKLTKSFVTAVTEAFLYIMMSNIATAEEKVIDINDPYARNEYGGFDDYCSDFEDSLKQYYGWSIEVRTAPGLEKVNIETTEDPWHKPFPQFVARITFPEAWALDKLHMIFAKYVLLPYLRSQIGADLEFYGEKGQQWGRKLAPWLLRKMHATEVSMVEDIVEDFVADDE